MVLPSEMEPSARRVSFIIVLIQQQQARNVYVERRSVSEYKVDMARTGKKVGRPAKKDLTGVRRQAKGPKVKRNRYLLRTKLKVVELHESGKLRGLKSGPSQIKTTQHKVKVKNKLPPLDGPYETP